MKSVKVCVGKPRGAMLVSQCESESHYVTEVINATLISSQTMTLYT